MRMAPAHDRRFLQLQGALEACCAARGISQAWVGVRSLERSYQAAISDADSDAAFEVNAGCLAKVLTATLVCQLISEGTLGLTDEVLHYLPLREARFRKLLEAVTVEQLLNHTHGLDDSALEALPREEKGTIDLPGLLEILSRGERLSPAGALYNYGSAGACLAAAVLEQRTGCRYPDVLVQRALSPLGLELRPDPTDEAGAKGTVNPATGGIMLPFEGILRFLTFHLEGGPSRRGPALPLMFASSAPLPGWSPAETAVARGWKGFRGGWFGHNANLPDWSVITRLHPAHRIALLVAVRTSLDAAFPVMAELLGEALPDLATVSIPTLLNPQQRQRLERQKYVGPFVNATQEILFEETQDGLCVSTSSAEVGGPLPRTPAVRLRPAMGDIFFVEPPGEATLPFVQFICPGTDARARYIWNGRNVWRRREH
jgi:hypothetical protein